MQDVYEYCPEFENEKFLLRLISKEAAYELFYCKVIATKAVPEAIERLQALRELGFIPAKKVIVSQDGTTYGDYYILENK